MTYGVSSPKSTSHPVFSMPFGIAPMEEFAGGERLVPVMHKGFKMSFDTMEVKGLSLVILSMA